MVDNVMVLDEVKHIKELMALRTFVNACMRWCSENKNYSHTVGIEEIWYDVGAGMRYTALVTHKMPSITENVIDSWQSFCPRDWLLIVNCDSIAKLIDMAWTYMDEIHKGKICVDLYKKFESEV